MKVLESAPERYDRGIRLLSGGAVSSVHARVAELVAAEGKRVLDVGCGTGNLTLACAERGANVVGIDIDAGMLAVARRKKPNRGSVEWVELGAMEIEDRFGLGEFDAAVSCLAFSELSLAEQAYVLRILRGRVKPGGRIAIADEVLPKKGFGRLWSRLARVPHAIVTYVLTQTTTRPVDGLEERIREAGYADVTEERFPANLVVVSALNPEAS